MSQYFLNNEPVSKPLFLQFPDSLFHIGAAESTPVSADMAWRCLRGSLVLITVCRNDCCESECVLQGALRQLGSHNGILQ